MANISIEDKQRADLKLVLEEIIADDPNILVQDATYSQLLDVPKFRLSLKRTIELFKQLSESYLDDLPEEILSNLKREADQFSSLLHSVADFNPGQSRNAKQEVENFIQRNRTIYKDNILSIKPIINYSLISDKNFKAMEDSLKSKLKIADNIIKETLDKSNNTIDDINKLAAQHSVSPYATSFQQQASNHRIGAYLWLAGGIVLLISAFIFGYHYNELLILPEKFSTQQLIQNSIIKLTLISAILTGLALCVKNYRVNRHNFIINTHRINSLSTFRLFLEAADVDALTKKTFLIQAAQSIFSTPKTGYISNEPDSDSSNKVIEIFRNISEKKD